MLDIIEDINQINLYMIIDDIFYVVNVDDLIFIIKRCFKQIIKYNSGVKGGVSNYFYIAVIWCLSVIDIIKEYGFEY